MSLSENEVALDIHYAINVENSINSSFILGLSDPSQLVPQVPTSVQDAPPGETLEALDDWLNPPMQLGVEYRTTERYQQVPIYTKAVNFGAAPNATSKTVEHGITGFNQCVDVSGILGGANLIGHKNIVGILVNASQITIEADADLSRSNVYVILKYTKATS